MQILRIDTICGERVLTDDEEYTRYSSDNWSITMGCSEEFDCLSDDDMLELETAYQAFKEANPCQ
jgi:hypothetical protein